MAVETEKPVVEEVHENDEEHDPEQDKVVSASEDEGEKGKSGKVNRSEKKSRKAMQKLGMKPVSGITRVTIKRSKNILFVISHPDVFKSPASDTYVIFGEAKIEDLGATAQAAAAEQFKAAEAAAGETASSESAPAVTEDASTEELDESSLDQGDIEAMLQQNPKLTRAQVVKALLDNGGDLINALMSLSKA